MHGSLGNPTVDIKYEQHINLLATIHNIIPSLVCGKTISSLCKYVYNNELTGHSLRLYMIDDHEYTTTEQLFPKSI